MMKFALLLSYDGSRYCGWQTQTRLNRPSIQTTLTEALNKMTGETVTIVGSGRTDAGVHAIGQVGHFVLRKKKWDADVLLRGANALLPQSIRVLAVREVTIEFHAQRDARKKTYSYYFLNGPAPLPHLKRYTLWIRKPLDLQAMSEACEALKGRHDFLAFKASGSTAKGSVREIFSAEIDKVPLSFPQVSEKWGRLLRFRISGEGFLKQMVRSLAGTLLEIGEGRRPAGDFPRLIQAGERKLIGRTLSPAGLWLEKVDYDQAIFDNSGLVL